MSSKSQAETIEAIVSGPRTPGRLNGAELLLLLELRRQGWELVESLCQGPYGPYQHRRVIRKRKAS